MLLCLLTGGLCYTQQPIAHAQATGGGSTENFKRPSNPPVYHQPKIEPLGGHLKPDKATKPNGAGAGAANAAQKGPAENDPRLSNGAATKPAVLPKFGNLKSGGGMSGATKPAPPVASAPSPANTTPVPQPVAAAPSATNSASPPAENYEDVEDAIEAGNNARDRKPPDYVAAERAYKLASKLAPDDARSFEGLGNIYFDQQRNEEAVAAYRKAIELKPDNPAAFENLGDAYYRLGRYQESIDASTQSIRLDPTPSGPYWTMTWSNLTIGQGETAGKMAQAFVSRWRPLFAGDPPYYITFAGYLGYREAGRTEEANRLLATPGKLGDCQDQKWVCNLLKYFRHELTAEQLLAEANNNGKMTEARAYIGIDLALSGRQQEALAHLHWVVTSGDRTFTEYPLAQAWLTKLENRER
jgi:tetratricopeptide (TPR) repeat protein